MAKEASKKEYIEAVGRRKTAVARVRMAESNKNEILVNEKPLDVYFPTDEMREIVREPLSRAKPAEKFRITVRAHGGGIHAQAEAVRLGVSRGLLAIHEELKRMLRDAGLLTRDARMKERRKFGLKKARRAPQWSKR